MGGGCAPSVLVILFMPWEDLPFPTLPPWLAQVVAQHVLMSWPLDFLRKMWRRCKVGG